MVPPGNWWEIFKAFAGAALPSRADARPVIKYVTLKDPPKAFVLEVFVDDEHRGDRQSNAAPPQVLVAWESVPLAFTVSGN